MQIEREKERERAHVLAMSGNVPNVTTAIFCSLNIEYCGTMVMVVRRLDIASILYQCIILNQCCSDGSTLVSLLY